MQGKDKYKESYNHINSILKVLESINIQNNNVTIFINYKCMDFETSGYIRKCIDKIINSYNNNEYYSKYPSQKEYIEKLLKMNTLDTITIEFDKFVNSKLSFDLSSSLKDILSERKKYCWEVFSGVQ